MREIYRNVSLVEGLKLIVLRTQEPGTSNEIIKWQFWTNKGSLFNFLSLTVVNYAAKAISKLEFDLESPFRPGRKHRSVS